MDMEITPDCPECHGKGSVPFYPGDPACFDQRPCGACYARWYETHCDACGERLGPTYMEGGHRRVCSRACGDVVNRSIRASWTPLVTWNEVPRG